VGLAGLGRAGWLMHCDEIEARREKFRLVAACDVEADRCARVAARFGCRTYTRIEDLIADPEVELVDIATRSPDHVRHATLALRAGKDVFLEKPIATSYADARRLLAEARRARGTLYVRHNRRFEGPFNHIRDLIASGILGDVHSVKLRRNGFQRRNDWQTILRCGGGQLLNWGPHIVDHALQYLGAPVADLWSDLQRIAAVGDAEDHVKIVLRGTNGRVVDLEISGGAALGEPETIVLGTRGALSCDGREIRLRYLDPKVRLPARKADPGTPSMDGNFGGHDTLQWLERTIPVDTEKYGGFDCIWDALYPAIRQGRKFPVTLEESLEVMRVISAVRKGTRFELKPSRRS
jgi:predicted dehydrogenase